MSERGWSFVHETRDHGSVLAMTLYWPDGRLTWTKCAAGRSRCENGARFVSMVEELTANAIAIMAWGRSLPPVAGRCNAPYLSLPIGAAPRQSATRAQEER